MTEQNELLRSAYQIAMRQGKDTNWVAFSNNIKQELLRHAGIHKTTDEQMILRATCTPKTYRTFNESSQPVVKADTKVRCKHCEAWEHYGADICGDCGFDFRAT